MLETKRRYVQFFLAVAMLLAASGLSACNTMSGAGQDIKAGGKAIEETAEDTKAKM